jgi:hypothetical protein
MVASAVQVAKRTLLATMRAVALSFGMVLTCNRDSSDKDVVVNFRKLALRVHPDRAGGSTAQQGRLNDARAAWEAVLGSSQKAGRPKNNHEDRRKCADPGADGILMQVVVPASKSGKEYRLHSSAAMLTYMGFEPGLAQWGRFLGFVADRLKPWKVKQWCATLETTKEGEPHVHLMLQFNSKLDRSIAGFVFEGLRPNASSTDHCGEGLCRKKMQPSIDRGFFYVWADKLGTCRDADDKPCVAGNYAPCWTTEKLTYEVKGGWPEKLWKQRKLSSSQYKSYLYLSRDGVLARRRNLDEVQEEESRLEQQFEIEANTKRIRSNAALYKPFPTNTDAVAWLQLFLVDALRYPILIVLGASMTGKTEWAKSLFKAPLELKIGNLAHFPDALRSFNRKTHDGIVLDDIRDLGFLTDVQDKLQGKYDALLEFASTPGGLCKYAKYLFQVPIVATANYSTKNLTYLDDHDWLGKPGNRTVVHYGGFGQGGA